VVAILFLLISLGILATDRKVRRKSRRLVRPCVVEEKLQIAIEIEIEILRDFERERES
jgi:hypothetical protein